MIWHFTGENDDGYLFQMGEGKLTGGWIIPLSVVGDDSSSVTLAKVPGY